MNVKTRVIVDGYNVLKSTDQFARLERQSLEVARNALVDYISPKIYQYDLIVVFDGWESGSAVETSERVRGVKVIYSRLGERADDVIVRLVAATQSKTIVVTRDGVLRQRVVAEGGQVEAPEALFTTPKPPRRFRTQPDDEDQPYRPGKKGPSSRPKKSRGPGPWHL
jgi:predicted RNA-binding protein with PIN domain